MTTRSLILHPHEVLSALRGELGLVVRPVKPQPMEEWTQGVKRLGISTEVALCQACPLGVPGDRLRCKEPYYIQGTCGQHRADGLRWGSWSGLPTTISSDGKRIVYYKEGFDRCAPMWRSPATMPSWASRITLEVTGVRCVRAKNLTDDDAYDMGVQLWATDHPPMFNGYPDKYNSIHAAMIAMWTAKYGTRYPWETSWVWAAEVRRMEG